MKIKRIYANNCFKFYENHVLDATFGDVTEVCGINEAGKSTIKKIIQWILNCRDENGKEITGIRPHDKNGNDVNTEDCTAFIELEIDGTVKQLKKVYRQNVNKKGEVTGNVTECYINDILKKAGDYKEFLEENFENLSYCINAMTLLSKNASDQREILNNVFSTHTDSDICDMDSSFEELKPMFEDGSVKELKDRCNRVLNGSKGKNATKGLKQQAAEYQSRIDELNLQKVNIDVAELELHRSGLKKELDEVIEKQKDSSSTVKEHDGFLDEIMKLKFEISEIQNSANDELQKQKGYMCLADKLEDSMEFDERSSDWEGSQLREYLNTEFFEKISDEIGEENIITFNRDLTSIDGQTEYGECEDKVSLLTIDEYRKYRKLIPNTNYYWWLISPWSTPCNDWNRSVAVVAPAGVICGSGCGDFNGVRPVCIFSSLIFESEE